MKRAPLTILILTLALLSGGCSSAGFTPGPPPAFAPSATAPATEVPPADDVPVQLAATLPPQPTLRPTPTGGYQDPLAIAAPLLPENILAWAPSRPVTVLLLGLDRRPGEVGRTRTDTMMVVSYAPSTKQLSVISIPRDLYVQIPGYGNERINAAYVYGGGALAKRTVEQTLGITIHHYAAVDIHAVEALIDEIGGLDINVPYTINDPLYPDNDFGYEPLYIPAGIHHMDGELAVKYARTRHNLGDFDRSHRQQQVMMAIRDRLVDSGTLRDLAYRAPGLYQLLAASFDTDMPFEHVVSLGWSLKDVPRENIRMAVIDGTYVRSYTTPDGASVLLPNSTLIHQLVTDVLP